MSADADKAVYRRALHALTARDADELRAVLAEDVLDHNPIPGQPAGAEGFVQFMEVLHGGIAEMALEIDLLLAEGGLVAGRVVWHGVHAGPLVGVPASGRRVRIPALHIVRVVDDRITEWWGHADISALSGE